MVYMVYIVSFVLSRSGKNGQVEVADMQIAVSRLMKETTTVWRT